MIISKWRLKKYPLHIRLDMSISHKYPMSISSKRRGGHLGPVASVQPFPDQVHQDLKLVKQSCWTDGGVLQDEENRRSYLLSRCELNYQL